MDPRLLELYEEELRHLRDMGAEFARQNPGVARRLGMEGIECADPYVERLLEGFSFMAARVRLKLDAEFPRFTQHLLEMVYPHYLSPTPSMAIVQFQPDLKQGALSEGFTIERGSLLRTSLLKGTRTACEYRTAHDVTLWPIRIDEAEYFTHALDVPGVSGNKAALTIRLKTVPGLSFAALSLDRLTFHLRGTEEQDFRLYEQIHGHGMAVVAQPSEPSPAWRVVQDRSAIRRVGFGDDEALLPVTPQAFRGYRLLHEYFAFPQRYCFVELTGLQPAVQKCAGDALELLILFDRADSRLDHAINAGDIALFCAPAVNLFELDADRIHISEADTEFHVVPDRTRSMDLEVYRVLEVVGHGTAAEQEQQFLPFYASRDITRYRKGKSFYIVNREPRVLSDKQQREGTRAGYVGHEVFLSLVDANAAPYSPNLRQLEVRTLCTNRDLPLMLALGQSQTDFTMKTGAPIESIRCLTGPTRPVPSHVGGELAWRLVNHLSLNYLSLSDTDEQRGAEALRSLLGLYANVVRDDIRQQIESIRSVRTTPIVRRLPTPGPLTFVRGLEVQLTLDESGFQGVGAFLLGSVIESFFSKYVSINSFTETVLKTVNRGEIMRWPARLGCRQNV